MNGAEIPMFPLGRPCLPGELLALRIFEPRYVAMLEFLSSQNRPQFGVVMIERGSEVGGGDVRRSLGTMMEIVRIDALSSKSFSVLAVGIDRIRVRHWLEDDPYPRAVVESCSDLFGESGDSALVGSVDPARFPRTNRALSNASLDDIAASRRLFALASMLQVGPWDVQRLLEAESGEERETVMEDILVHLEELAQFTKAPYE